MSDLLKDPMGNGSKFWAKDMLTSLGITVDEAVDFEKNSNSNGTYLRFPNGTQIVYGVISYDFDQGGDQIKDLPATFVNSRIAFSFSPSNASYHTIDDSALLVAGLTPRGNQMRVRHVREIASPKTSGSAIFAYTAIGDYK